MTRRLPAALLGAALICGLAPGVALAAPANDDFDGASEITALPFRTTLDTTGATKASDDPYPCDASGDGSVWLRYTAPAAGIVRLSVRSDDLTTPLFAVFTGTRGALTPLPGTCSIQSPFEDTFHVEAGTTYHVLVQDRWQSEAGQVAVSLAPISAEPNDDRASARVTGLPARLEGDLRRATAEPGEMPPSCDAAAVRSVWYRYTATRTRYVSLHTERTAISVHRASDLTEVDCVAAPGVEHAVFRAVQGETYLIRVADSPRFAETFMLDVGTANPALAPQISTSPWNPQPGSEIEFYLSSGDEHGKQLVAGTITFGDGSSAPITPGQRILHRYAQAGSYQVTVTGSTSDGRSGTGSAVIGVK
jgi:hypothetical protein